VKEPNALGKPGSEIVCQHLDNVSRDLLEQNQEIVRQYIRQRQGVYALFRRGKTSV